MKMMEKIFTLPIHGPTPTISQINSTMRANTIIAGHYRNSSFSQKNQATL